MAVQRSPLSRPLLLVTIFLLTTGILPAVTHGAPAAAAITTGPAPLSAEVVPSFPTDTRLTAADGAEGLMEGDWWAAVQEDIGRSEYKVTWQEQTGLPDPPAPSSGDATDENVPQAAGLRVGGREPQSSGLRYSPASGAYQAPNRAHNLRTTFTSVGITIVSRTELSPTWSLSLALAGFNASQPAVTGNQVTYRYAAPAELSLAYLNDESGLHQRITLAEPPDRTGRSNETILALHLDGTLIPRLASDGESIVYVAAEETEYLQQGQLAAVDARGRALPARFRLAGCSEAAPANPCKVEIVIAAATAEFPVVVSTRLVSLMVTPATLAMPTPTPTATPSGPGPSPAPDWAAYGGQAGAGFGAANTAGDVNGDGYSDVIVGAYKYDHGESDEGAAFLYYGSADGLKSTPAWMGESNQSGAEFGVVVSTAGDVNGDGYSDVIIGARGYRNTIDRQGKAYVFFGSPAGLSSIPGWTALGETWAAYFGTIVGSAGDVNGDGYSDIIIGSHGFDGGLGWAQGRAYVWCGSPSGPPAAPCWVATGAQGSDYFAYTGTGTAGDVNGDGYSDVVVSAIEYSADQAEEGRVYLYYGSASGLRSTPSWIVDGNQAVAHLGYGWPAAGDVNGDGYADIILGAPLYDAGGHDEGATLLYYGGPAGPSATADWRVVGNQADANFGVSARSAGDLNGDGYADAIVGAYRYDGGQTDEGAAFVYYGSADGLKAAPALTIEANQAGAYLGDGASTAGDVNGDGYSDLIVNAGGYDHSYTDEGAAFVYHGGPDGLSATADWTAEGNQAGARLGLYTVSTAGDVNGDGFDDILAGAANYDNGEADEGRAFLYYGSAAGLANTPAWTVEGNQVGASFGAVSAAGDVNGDGYSDVVIGAPGYDGSQIDGGQAYVYYGSANGLSASANWTGEGTQPAAYYGYSVSAAGDVNGDGYGDIIVGAYGDERYQTADSTAYAYYGSASGLSPTANWVVVGDRRDTRFAKSVSAAGDVNGDGYSDVVVGEEGHGSTIERQGKAYLFYGSPTGLGLLPGWTALGATWAAGFGFVVGTAGDVNGDGYGDIVVGSPGYDGGVGWAQGAVYVYRGSATGLQPSADWMVVGDQSNSYFGVAANTAGDVNGDGYADLVVGAHRYSNGQYEEGRASLYLGSRTGLNNSVAWLVESDQTQAYYGWWVSSAGDVNGDGYADLIVGAAFFDAGQTDEGAAFVYYGNRGGLSLRPQQRRSDNGAPVAYLGQSDQPDRFRLALLGRTPFGRGHVKLEWEVKPRGVPFDGTNLGRSASWLDTGTAGAQLEELAGGLSADTLYHWRVRLLYHPATTPFQQYSRWITNPWNGWNEARLRTGGVTPPLPTPTPTPTPTPPAAGTIEGTVWHDLDGNGIRDAGEPGLAGVQVCAEPLGHRPVRCATSGEDGAYRIELDASGTYLVAPSAAPAGMWLTTQGFRLPVVVRAGQQVRDVDFGYR